MIIRTEELRCKDVINLKDGIRVGSVDDLEVDTNNAEIRSLVIYGRKRFFGLMGRDDDIILKWDEIDIIGEDAILVNLSDSPRIRKKKGFFDNLFK